MATPLSEVLSISACIGLFVTLMAAPLSDVLSISACIGLFSVGVGGNHFVVGVAIWWWWRGGGEGLFRKVTALNLIQEGTAWWGGGGIPYVQCSLIYSLKSPSPAGHTGGHMIYVTTYDYNI